MSGGSVAKILLQNAGAYRVRALTRNPDSAAATELQDLGAELFQADLNSENEVNAAFEGCWGVFAVTNSYDPVSGVDYTHKQWLTSEQAVIAKPALEEEQGRIMARAAKKAAVHCCIWSTLPSSLEFSNGEIDAFIYECTSCASSLLYVADPASKASCGQVHCRSRLTGDFCTYWNLLR